MQPGYKELCEHERGAHDCVRCFPDEAHEEIERLKKMLELSKVFTRTAERADAEARAGVDLLKRELLAETREIIDMRGEIERLKVMVVWTSQRETYVSNGKFMVGPVDEYPCDGSPASILAAVGEAMNAQN